MGACPECGVDVSGCREMADDDDSRMWRQPVSHSQTADGKEVLVGGLTHIEGGRRCRADRR